MRFSRQFRLREYVSLDAFIEATNVLNSKIVSGYNSTTLNESHVDPATGLLRGPLPDLDRGSVSWRPSRQMQVGLRLSF
jgi:hypothetical protein